MQQLAHRFDLDCEITVLPNGVLAVNSGTGRSSLVTASRETLRFDQTERLFAVLRAGGTGRISAEAGLRELRRIVQIPPPVRAPWRFGGYCLMAVGLCLRQNPGLGEFIAALALSIPVAALLIAMPRLGGLKALIPAVMAFAVGAARKKRPAAAGRYRPTPIRGNGIGQRLYLLRWRADRALIIEVARQRRRAGSRPSQRRIHFDGIPKTVAITHASAWS